MTALAYAVTACPACGAAAFVGTGPEAPGCDASFGDRRFLQPPYSVHDCLTCGLLYKTQTLSAAELDAYYARVDFRKWEMPGHFPTERAALALLRTLPRGARLLDFGCSSGRLLAPLVRDYECSGFEINAEAAQAAAAKGIKMLARDFLERGEPDSFDAAVLVDVFEHLSTPTDLLRELFRLVKPGGLLVVVTGNGDTRACRLDPAQFWYFRNVEHLIMLTRRHTGFLAMELGVQLVVWRELSHYETPWREHAYQCARHFAFWQFQHRTLLAKTLLPLLPILNRARAWEVAPAYTASADHVLAVFQKQ